LRTINRIVYATDLSSTSEPAWDEARRLGQLFNVEHCPAERIHVRLSPGVPGEHIVHQAQDHGDDLIVLGTHGWSGIVRRMLGSVAQYVIQAAPCPVLTIAPAGAMHGAHRPAKSQRHRR
jgi:nucleotide-binding universal stress UspA family protein